MNETKMKKIRTGQKQQGETDITPSDPTPLLNGGKEVRCIRSAKKLLGKLISSFIRREINGEDSRTLCYLVTSYVTICKDNDILERIESLEEKLTERKL